MPAHKDSERTVIHPARRRDRTRSFSFTVLDVVGGKWKTLILWELHPQSRRFGELRRLVEGISEKVLIQQLRELEADGIVHREQYNEVPPRVEYSLTALGESLNSALMPLCDWGERHMDRIVSDRDHAVGECRAVESAAVAAR